MALDPLLLPVGSAVALSTAWLLLLPLLGRKKDARSKWGTLLLTGGRFAATAFSSASSNVSQPMAARHAVADATVQAQQLRLDIGSSATN